LALRQLAGTGADSARRKRAKGLNENYGRELLELHTLGVDGGYTQQDVIAVARAFTGWSVDRPREGGGFIFRPAMHDAGEKNVLGHHLPAGRGVEDGEDVLDILSRQPATARFIATKLVRRFVADTAPPALVDRVAGTFERTDGDIRACVRTIVTSPEFFSRAAYKSKIKSPFELVVSALRTVGAGADDSPRTAQIVARLGQPLYGHQAPNGYPETGDAWMNTGAIVNRINFGLALAGGRLPGVSLASWEALVHVEGTSRAEQIDGVVRSVLGGEASPDTRRVLESGINPMLSVALAPDSTGPGADSLMMAGVDSVSMMNGAGITAPSVATSSATTVNGPSKLPGRNQRAGRRADPLGPPGELGGLSQMVGLALGAPEFQRR
jgi:hypothetical protein